MIILENSDKCTACGGCTQACPTNAVSLCEDNEGFLYPRIDMAACTRCGRCASVCHIIHEDNFVDFKKCYYGRNANESTVLRSSSGGMFKALSDVVLDSEGVIIGVYFDSEAKEMRFGTTETMSRNSFMKSKYVESITEGIYTNAKALLESGNKVLFSGTPCQVDGLLRYLGGPCQNLTTVDFICHGVPSRSLFKEHVRMLEKRHGAGIRSVDFRRKTLGWTTMSFWAEFANGKKYETAAYADEFFRGFLEDLTLRKSCYSCDYRERHCADITIADFWGYKTINPKLNDEKGLSLLLTTSERGDSLISACIKNGYAKLEECSPEVAKYALKKKASNPELLKKRKEFFASCQEVGFDKAARRAYMKNKRVIAAKFYIKKMLFARVKND